MNQEDKLQFLSVLATNMEALRQDKYFVDVTIVCGTLSFPAHRFILASYSGYFKSMFTCEMKESEESIIHIEKPLDTSALESILLYMYSGDIDVTQDIPELLEAAEYLQVDQVSDMCCEHLLDTVTADKFVDAWDAFDLYQKNAHLLSLIEYLAQDSSQLHCHGEILTLSADRLRNLLECEEFSLDGDGTVALLFRWMNCDVPNRKEELKQLLETYPRPLNLSKEYLADVIEDEPIAWEYPMLCKSLSAAFLDLLHAKQPVKSKETITAVDISAEKIRMQEFNPGTGSWLDVVQVELGPVDVNGVHCVTGNKKKLFLLSETKFFVFNVGSRSWQMICCPPENVSAAARIFSVGHLVYLVDRFNVWSLRLNANDGRNWKTVAQLPVDLSKLIMVTVFQETLVCISTTSLHLYDRENDEWLLENMVGEIKETVAYCFDFGSDLYLYSEASKEMTVLSRSKSGWSIRSCFPVNLHMGSEKSACFIYYDFDKFFYSCNHCGVARKISAASYEKDYVSSLKDAVKFVYVSRTV